MTAGTEDATGRNEELPPRAAAALAAAGIPPSRRGPARRARLTPRERTFYFWIMCRFAGEGRPGSGDTRAEATRLGLHPEQVFATLAREDLVHLGADGEIAVAYPFSGVPTAHRVRFPGGQEVNAMCALDALGIAPMFEEPIDVRSCDPLSGETIQARVGADGLVEWWPESAAVVAGVLDRQAESCSGCCPVLNFFASPANAQRWLAEHPDVRGEVISIDEAAAAGRAVFGEVLTPS